MVFYFLTGEVRTLGVENLSSSFHHANLALSARPLASAGRRKMHAVIVERSEQAAALLYSQCLFVIDDDVYIPTGWEVSLGYQEHCDQQQDGDKEYSDANEYELSHFCEW